MKLCRIGKKDQELPAIIDEKGNYRDLSSIISDFDSDNLNFETIEKIKELNLNELKILDRILELELALEIPLNF